MDLKLSPEHEAFREGLRAFIAQHGDKAAVLRPAHAQAPRSAPGRPC